jgi:uncharacterized protein (TIGR03437 family)
MRLVVFLSLVAAPLIAQTQIGGGTCNSSSLNGTYALSLTGRAVSSTGTFTNALQANGSATFDGLSMVTMTFAENTTQNSGTIIWSGTYSVESNCSATVTITSGGTGTVKTLNVEIYNQAKDFIFTGSDATFGYSGSGSPQATGCSTGTLSGVYTFNTTGFALTSGAISGPANSAGLLQFDGNGNATATLSTSTSGATNTADTLSGTYSVTLDCIGTATLADSSGQSFLMGLSIYSDTATNTNFFVTLKSATALMSGGGHTASSSCSASTLDGSYALNLSARGISSSGAFTGGFQGVGTITFDGKSSVTIAGTYNSNMGVGQAFSYTGTYTLPSNCDGTGSFTIVGPAAFTLVVWSGGKEVNLVGSDQAYVYTASAGNTVPVACATATLSGEYIYTASGFDLTGMMQTGAGDEAGVLQFDGQGNVTATYTDTQGGAMPVSKTATGTYKVTSGCQGTATLTDASGTANTLNFVIEGADGQTLNVLNANSGFLRDGSAHSAFTNPSQAITNVASYAVSATPPGSVFALFGQNLATKAGAASTSKLPTTLLTTSVTVNGELAPLFYVSPTQIDAQMPWDIPGGAVATVIVTNGNSVSNAAGVYVPATGTPGISTYGTNRAVVVNVDGSVNSGATPAMVGDEVVAYFTGGGPVMASGTLTTGEPAPTGLSPLSGMYSITVGGQPANVAYIGLTPGSIGLYQANFTVPQVAKGAYPVVITIAGQASNSPVMNVSN